MIPSIIIAPLDAPQIFKPAPVPPAPRRLDWIDEKIIEVVRDGVRVKTWSALNLVAAEFSAKDRAAQREARMRLLPRVRQLLKLGLLFRAGRNAVAAFKPTANPAGMWRRRRNRTVRQTAPNKAVSVVKSASPPEPGSTSFTVRAEVLVAKHGGQETPPIRPITECAPSPAEVSLAAKSLALLPRRPKRWSGWLNDRVRTYRNMPIELLGGDRVYAFGARRGKVVYVREPNMCAGDPDEAGRSWGVVPASSVQVIKTESAVLLGRQKRGVRERQSPLKAASARRNGRQPPRAGSRPRGRPRSPQG